MNTGVWESWELSSRFVRNVWDTREYVEGWTSLGDTHTHTQRPIFELLRMRYKLHWLFQDVRDASKVERLRADRQARNRAG